MLCDLCLYPLAALGCVALFRLLTYLIPHCYVAYLCKPQDLKKKYNAEWALVTGGSSGIGRAVVDKLALQGFNVVVASLEDDLLRTTGEELRKMFPSQEFRTVGVNLSPGQNYMEAIAEATSDVDVQVVFANAGYITTGFFDQTAAGRQLANLECNLTAAVAIAHHFTAAMIAKGKKGCVVFTSSAAAAIPSPFSVIYATSKAGLSALAASLAVEVQAKGVDVLAIHPSPVNSKFYDNTHKLEALDFARLFQVQPEALPDEIFKSIGRLVWRDIGGFCVVLRMCMAAIDFSFAAQLFAFFAPYSGDYKKHNKPAGSG